tara:strand:- start:2143 stop:3093 length:951 start_codon:yes stop_codon:yes gene_type:complete
MEKVSWGRWTLALIKAAEELREAGFVMSKDPSQDNEVYQNLIALSAAEWRKGNEVDMDGPGMGKAIGGEESYSPLQIYMTTWGKDTSDVDVTVINNEFVPEFQGITKDELIDLITTDVELAAKAGIIVLNSKKGYDNWSTWDIVQSEDTPQYIDYAKQFDNDLLRGSQFDGDEPVTTTSTTTTTTTMPTTTTTMPTTTTTEPQDTEIDTTSRSAGITNQFGTPPQDMEYKSQSDYQMIKFLTESVNKKREQNNLPRLSIADRINKKMADIPVGPITSKLRQGVDFIEDDIQEFRDNIEMPFGRPVNIEDVLDLLEP